MPLGKTDKVLKDEKFLTYLETKNSSLNSINVLQDQLRLY